MAEVRKLKFHVVTYNIAELKKPTEDIAPILELAQKPDVISVGLEESGDFDLLPDEEKEKPDAWCKTLDDLLGANGYYIVDITSVFQVKLRVYILKEHMHSISHVEATTAKSGFVGGVNNIFKAAAIVRFRLCDRHVAIINSHLTAFDERTLDRNTEYWQFFADQDFDDPDCDELYHHDYIIWSGDLNYRVEHDNTDTRQMIAEGRHKDLLQYDQLIQQQTLGLAFVGFHEGDINFPPTYKFDQGTDVYDTSKKQRVPSWCDRVLFRVKCERERIGSLVNWEPTLDEELSDSSSLSEEISKKSDVSKPAPDDSDEHKKRRLFKKKVMRRKDSTLRIEEMRRKTLGVLRKLSMPEGKLQDQSSDQRIELQAGDLTDNDRFRYLMEKISSESAAKSSDLVEVLSYTSYPELRMSDHKPVGATLNITFPPSSPSFSPKLELDPSGKCKVLIGFEEKVNPAKHGHWVGLYHRDWVNKVKYKSYVYVQKRKRPKGKLRYKATFGHGKFGAGEVVQAVYFSSQGHLKPCGFLEFTIR